MGDLIPGIITVSASLRLLFIGPKEFNYVASIIMLIDMCNLMSIVVTTNFCCILPWALFMCILSVFIKDSKHCLCNLVYYRNFN